LKNIRFFKGRREINHSDEKLSKAGSVSITFELQKRGTKFDTVTHHRSNDRTICPVLVWSKIVKRIRQYPQSTDDTTVNTFMDANKKLHQITGSQLLKQLRRAAQALGHKTLGFKPEQIGLHSARSGAAMAMYLAGVPVYTIMLLGRWSSDAFLRYMRKQVTEFSAGISTKMNQSEDFFTIPTADHKNSSKPRHNLEPPCTKFGLQLKEAARPLLRVFH
jgi:hypothetical protein